jgi:hypothetical protein
MIPNLFGTQVVLIAGAMQEVELLIGELGFHLIDDIGRLVTRRPAFTVSLRVQRLEVSI